MKSFLFKIIALIFFSIFTTQLSAQKFQGKAYYFSKSKMELGNWGARMSEAQKKQMQNRLKDRLEKKKYFKFQYARINFFGRRQD